MSTPAKLAAFAATLALLSGGGALAGGAINPERGEPRAPHSAATAENEGAAHGAEQQEHETVSTSSHTETNAHGASEESAHPVRGLAVAENGLRVVIDDPELRQGRTEQLRFRVVDERERTVRDFDVEHEKRMHLIIAR